MSPIKILKLFLLIFPTCISIKALGQNTLPDIVFWGSRTTQELGGKTIFNFSPELLKERLPPNDFQRLVKLYRLILPNKNFIWDTAGASLRVCFLDQIESQDVKKQIEVYVREWQTGNISFSFVGDCNNSQKCEIRIKTRINSNVDVDWSHIGKQSLLETNQNNPTMVLSNIYKFNPLNENFKRRVLHEFGHALGLLHEHQNLNCNFDWSAVFTEYSKAGITDTTLIKDNLQQSVNNQDFCLNFTHDPNSIMNYNFPSFFFLGSSPCFNPNFIYSLSDLDAINIQRLYSNSFECLQNFESELSYFIDNKKLPLEIRDKFSMYKSDFQKIDKSMLKTKDIFKN